MHRGRTAWATLRVGHWLHFVLLPGAALGPGAWPIHDALRGVLVAACALAYAYGLNAVADRRCDGARKNPLAGQEHVPRGAAVAVAVAGLAALALALGGRGPTAPMALLSLGAATVYSVGPRLKALPLVGTLLNVAIFAPLFAVGLGSAPRPAAFDVGLASFVALLLQNQLLHERGDRDEDARARVVTTARLLGERGTALATACLGVAGLVAAALLAPSRASALAAALTLVAASATGLRLGVDAARRRVEHRVVALAGGALLFAVGLVSG